MFRYDDVKKEESHDRYLTIYKGVAHRADKLY
jgi:hypothetical protein